MQEQPRQKRVYQAMATLVWAAIWVGVSCSPVKFSVDQKSQPPGPTPLCVTSDPACIDGTSPTMWSIGAWGTCSQACGGGLQTHSVACINAANQTLPDSSCKEAKPSSTQACNTNTCNTGGVGNWNLGTWSNCSQSCDSGSQSRTVECNLSSVVVADGQCSMPKPDLTRACNTQACPLNLVTKTKSLTVEPYMNQVDILLVIDDSSSMTVDNTRLSSRLAGFLQDLQVSNIDWRMCVTTTYTSYYSGNLLTWSTTNTRFLTKNTTSTTNNGNTATIVAETISKIGSGYGNDERGIQASVLAVRNNSNTTYNCFRPKTPLATIIISNEDERSVGGVQALDPIQYKPLAADDYPAALVSQVAQTFNTTDFVKKFAANVIVVKDKQCQTAQNAEANPPGTPSFVGVKYMELANLTGGAIGSVCDTDYSKNLNVFKSTIQNTIGSITLDCTPYGAPTVALPSGYNYTLAGNVVTFAPVLPQGANVAITYQCLQ